MPASRIVLRSELVSGVLAVKVFGVSSHCLGSTVVAHSVLHAFAKVAVDGPLVCQCEARCGSFGICASGQPGHTDWRCPEAVAEGVYGHCPSQVFSTLMHVVAFGVLVGLVSWRLRSLAFAAEGHGALTAGKFG